MPSVLSIFADESGEWGKRSEYYLITLVFHDQSKDISLALERYRQSLADYGLPDVPFHAGPLLTGHDAYEGMSLSERKRLLGLFVIMTRRLPITYRTFVHRKSDFDDNRQRFEAQLKRDIVNLLLAHLSDFHSYGTVKVYYDGGQQIVTDALRGGIEYALSKDAIVYRDASPRDYRLEQVADFLCTLELTCEKFRNGEQTETEATLLAAMEHASRWVGDKDLKAALDDDESHSGGIGTPATRADVIEKLIRTGYVDRKGKQLRSTEQGRSLIDVVAPKLKDVALTADMERRLSEVEHGQTDAAEIETEFRDLAAGIPADAQIAVRQDHVQARKRNTESFGPCPRCGKPVIKTGKVFQCSTNRREKQSDGTWRTTEGCGWRAWTTIAGKTITDTTMRGLLAGRKVSLKGFTSRKGSGFDAAILIDKDKGIAFDFNDNKERKRK